ncbi:MAG: PAS domain S-box protein [Patescibacteria group bacterium]|nr:PAS domain S-box protein [Patescibacteria group bacterium]
MGKGDWQKIMENEQEAEKNFLTFFDKVSDGVVLVELRTKKFRYGNKAMCRMLGVSPRDFKNMSVADIHPRKDLPFVFDQFDKLAKGKIFLAKSIPVKRKNKSIFFADITTSLPVALGGKNCLLGIFRDVSGRKREEENLLFIREIINNLGEGVVVANAATAKIILVNPKFNRLFGYKKDELVGRDVSMLNAPNGKSREEISRQIQATLNRRGVWQGEVYNKRKDGSCFWCSANVSTYVHPRFGKIWIGTHADITKHKENENRVAHLNEVLLAMRSVNKIIARERNPQLLLSAACKSLVSARGYPLAWMGMIKTDDKLVHPMAGAGEGLIFLKKLKVTWDNSEFGKGPTGTAIRSRRPITCSDIATDPSYAPWRARAKKFGFASSAVALIAYGKKIFGTINVYSGQKAFFDKEELSLLAELASDLGLALQSIDEQSEHRADEEKLFQSRQMLESIFDNIPERVFWKSDKLVYLGANAAAARDAGFEEPDELIGKTDYQMAWKKMANSYRADDRKVMASGIPKLNYEEPLIKSDGSRAWVNTNKVPLRDKSGKIFGVLGTYEDITDRKQTEEDLRKSQERFKNFSNLLPQTVFEMDKKGKLTFINHIGYKTFGYNEKDFSQGIYLLQLIAPADRKRAGKKILAGKKRKKIESGEYAALKKDGSTFPVIIYYNYTTQNDGHFGVRGSLFDITDIKQAEIKLKETAAKDEALLSSIADGVIAVDREAKIILINEAAKKLLGYSEKEALGKNWYEILKKQDEKGNEILHEKSEFEAALTEKTVSAAITPHYYVGKHGKRFPVARAVSPVISGGKIIGAINVFHDATVEKELDRAKTDFLSLASHQLRTPLSAMKWIMEILMQNRGFTIKQEEYIGDLYRSNERLIGLVNALLDVTRIQAGKLPVSKKSVRIDKLIAQAEETGKAAADKKGQKIKVAINTKIRPAIIDPLLFSEALGNLLNNASTYSPDKSQIDIAVDAFGGSYIISVHNLGPAIPRSEQQKIFTQFYRGSNAQDSSYIGSGLGLFITKAVVEANGGSIWFESTAERGTTLFFTVPK